MGMLKTMQSTRHRRCRSPFTRDVALQRTDDSPLGEVPVGEIVVVEKQSSRAFTGVYATRKVCLQVPLFFLYGLALYLPPVRALFGRDKQGCNGDACAI